MTSGTTVFFVRCAVAASLFLIGTMTSLSAATGEPDAGAKVFKSECAECHTVRQGRNKKGPSLFGIVGRPSASLPDYNYSDALRQRHWTWTEDQLRTYISQPAKKADPGTKMKYDGLDDPKQVDDLISYLSTLH